MANKENCISITIRPRLHNFQKYENVWKSTLISIFEKKNVGYIIGTEGGHSHFEICVITKQRSDNLKRLIRAELKYEPEDTAEHETWFNCVSHNNQKLRMGYCCKEDDYVHNFEDEIIKDAIEYWLASEKRKKEHKETGDWICTGINHLHKEVYKFAETEDMLCDKYSFKFLVTLLAANDMVPFSLSRKIKKDDESFWRMYKYRKMKVINIRDQYDIYAKCEGELNCNGLTEMII